MTDSTGTLSETHSSSSSNEPTETQVAQAGDQVQVTEPSLGTTIQLVAAGDNGEGVLWAIPESVASPDGRVFYF